MTVVITADDICQCPPFSSKKKALPLPVMIPDTPVPAQSRPTFPVLGSTGQKHQRPHAGNEHFILNIYDDAQRQIIVSTLSYENHAPC